MTAEQVSTRSRIVAESLRLFAEKGYEATTLHEIAETVGIKTASLYAHYNGKDAIFREVLEAAVKDWETAIASVFGSAESQDSLEEGVAAILGGLMAALGESVSYRFWARVYVFPPPPITKEDLGRFAEMDGSMSVRLEQYCSRKAPPGTQPESISAFSSTLINMVMGFLMNSTVLDPTLVEMQLRRNVSFLVKALAS